MLSAIAFWGIYILLVAGAVGLFAATGRATNSTLTRPRLYTMGAWTFKLSLAHAAGLMGTLALFTLFIVYWFFNHRITHNGEPVPTAEHYARAFGQITAVFFGLLIIPATDRSVLHTVLGTRGFIWMHRVLGYGMLIGVACHAAAFSIAEYKEHKASAYLYVNANNTSSTHTPGHDDEYPTMRVISCCCFVMFIAMGLLAVEPVRRRAYHIFFNAHQIAAYATLPVALCHADGAACIYLLPGVTVWLVDRIMRYKRAPQAATLVDLQECADDVVILRFSQPGLNLEPGQYVFIQVPEISTFEWHPFTVSAIDPEKEEFTLHIKVVQPQLPASNCELPYFYLRWLPKRELTWTQQLQGAMRNGAKVSLCVEGPCGAVHDLSKFQQVLFIAGGIGITPCSAHLQRLRCNLQPAAQRMELHWAVRDADLATAFAPMVDLLPNEKRYHGVLYVTTRDPASSDATDGINEDVKPDPLVSPPSTSLQITSGRPNLVQIMDSFAANKDLAAAATVVVVCGPYGMVDICSRMAIERGFACIEDAFAFL